MSLRRLWCLLFLHSWSCTAISEPYYLEECTFCHDITIVSFHNAAAWEAADLDT